jgi:hypothetical protein
MTAEPNAMADDSAPRPWLVALKERAASGDRPRDKPFGRWLGDFLDQNTANGLLNTELDLLDACTKGGVCEPRVRRVSGATWSQDTEAARRAAVADRPIRARFLRFLALGGDVFAPVHEAGIELYEALIDGKIDLRGGRCVGRIALLNCVVLGELSIEDGQLGTLVLRGSSLRGLNGNRARISGTVFLDEGFVSAGDVSLFSARIRGSLVCDDGAFQGAFTCSSAAISGYWGCKNAVFAGEVSADGVAITGDVRFFSITAMRPVNLAGADIGGSLRCSGSTFRAAATEAAGTPYVMLDFSRAKIKGDVSLKRLDDRSFQSNGAVKCVSAVIGGDMSFPGAAISAGGKEEDNQGAINAQTVKVAGSVFFGAGFVATGEVSFSGAEIAKDLDFSDGAFHNESGYAILADGSKVAGGLKCQTTGQTPGDAGFRSFGEVFLAGARCGELDCRGGTFTNPGAMALDGSTIDVSGSVRLGNMGTAPFWAHGTVRFFTARIGQHLYCGGGRFLNPDAEALNAEAVRIAGCVFLNGCDDGVDTKDRADMAFQADGKVTFVGASVGLQFNCQSGRFRNGTADPSNGAYAGSALDLATATIGDTLFLGSEDPATAADDPGFLPATFDGTIDLTAATVRVLVDDGLTGGGSRGLRPTVTGTGGLTRQCNLKLDLFAYERLKARACKADSRMALLTRQPPEHLNRAFQPQPFEQVIKVLRAMGHDGEADRVALAKRTYARKSKPWWSSSRGPWALADCLARIGELIFVAWFLGYGYKVAQALLILLVLGTGFGWVYAEAFRQGAIVPADKDLRNEPRAAACANWSPAACPALADKVIPSFNPWLYSADVMIPVIGFGQKAAWIPTHGKAAERAAYYPEPSDAVYYMQLTETVLGWVGGILLLSFISGLIAKE